MRPASCDEQKQNGNFFFIKSLIYLSFSDKIGPNCVDFMIYKRPPGRIGDSLVIAIEQAQRHIASKWLLHAILVLLRKKWTEHMASIGNS